MSTTESSDTCATFRVSRPEPFIDSVTGPGSSGGIVSQGQGLLDRFGEQVRLTGITLGSDEADEFRVFNEFLARHVQLDRIRDVQCMLLWSEWVRAFRRQARAFPSLIRENEFQSVIMEMFGVGFSHDSFRGSVYPGIRFVP